MLRFCATRSLVPCRERFGNVRNPFYGQKRRLLHIICGQVRKLQIKTPFLCVPVLKTTSEQAVNHLDVEEGLIYAQLT